MKVKNLVAKLLLYNQEVEVQIEFYDSGDDEYLVNDIESVYEEDGIVTISEEDWELEDED